MAADAILENRKIAISAQPFDRFYTQFDTVTRIGTPYTGEHLKSQFKNPTWRTAAILKNRKCAISQQRIGRS